MRCQHLISNLPQCNTIVEQVRTLASQLQNLQLAQVPPLSNLQPVSTTVTETANKTFLKPPRYQFAVTLIEFR